MKKQFLQLNEILIRAVRKNEAEALLFSGGLDSVVLAGIKPDLKAITVNLERYAQDDKFTKFAVKHFNLQHYLIRINIEEAISSIPQLIRIVESFDPAIPNDLAVYFGLKKAKEMGLSKVMTGDGSDELFGGYDFMRDISDLEGYIKKISFSMEFSPNQIGRFFGLEIKQPYLEREVINFALNLPVEFKIRKEGSNVWGKWILRKAFEDDFPKEIIWQSKRPIEYGSGMNKLREIISSRVCDEEFAEKKKIYRVRFINKEHLYYYEIYKSIFGDVPKPQDNQDTCPGCGAGIRKQAFHCRICGWTEGLK